MISFGNQGDLYIGCDNGGIENENGISIFSIGDYKFQELLYGFNSPISCLAVSSDNRYLAIGGDLGELSIWDTYKKESLELTKHNDKIISLDFSPDDKYLISADRDIRSSQIKLFQVGNWKELKSDNPGPSGLTGAFFLSKNNDIAVGTSRQIKILDLNLDEKNVIQVKGYLSKIGVSKKRDTIYVVSNRGNISSYDEKGNQIQYFGEIPEGVIYLYSTPNQEKTIGIGSRGLIKIWHNWDAITKSNSVHNYGEKDFEKYDIKSFLPNAKSEGEK